MFFFHLMIAALLAFGSPSNGTVKTQDDPPVGGDTGPIIPPR
jgi:hypothetical protein